MTDSLPPGIRHATTPPKRFGHTFRTRCVCGWYYEGSFTFCEKRSNEHLYATEHENDATNNEGV